MSEPAAADSARNRPIPRSRRLAMLRHLVGLGLRVDMLTPLREMHERYGNAVLHDARFFRMAHLFGPDANRQVLLDRDGIFSARKPWDAIMGRIFPNGLLLRDGEDHKQHRRILHEAFKRPALRAYAERMSPAIGAALDGWCERRELLAFPAFKALTLDLAAAIFVGVDLGPETARVNRVFEDMVAASMSHLRLPIPGLEFQRGLRGRAFLVRYFGDLLPKKRADAGPDLFSQLCRAENDAGERLRDAEIVDHMIFLMMAAHDTTTSTLCSLAYELAAHPEWQERVRDESRALGRGGLAFDELERLPSLGLAMRETLRLHPPLPVIPRMAGADFEFEGYRLPAGTLVVVAPIHTHQMPEWWSAPQRFDPERFAPPRSEDARHTHSWIPFGGGPHHCIGLRFAELVVKGVVHQLVQRYRWRVPDGYRMPAQQAPIAKPRDGLPLALEPLA